MQLEAILRLNRDEIRCTHEAMEYIDKKYADASSLKHLLCNILE